MNRKLFIPILLLVIVALACGLPGGSSTSDEDDAATPQTATAVDEPSPSTAGEMVTQLSQAEKAVVRIVTTGAYEYPEGKVETGFTGSGFIIDPSGLAVTNNHVVTGAALIEVYFYGDSKPYRARLLASSECSDLALIDIEGEGFTYFDWFTDDIELGLQVYALGYPRGDPEFTRHQGFISKKQATAYTNWTDVSSVVEHDAIINPGSSGGPLVTAEGKVVGINYASNATDNRYLAITYKEALPVLEDLKAGKDVLAVGINGEAWLFEDGSSGIWIYSVTSGSPADKAGMRAGDFLMEMEGITLAKEGTLSEYCGILRGKPEGAVLGVKVVRIRTGEVLEGQINGRQLEVIDNFSAQPSGQSGSTSAEGYFDESFDGDLSNWSQFVAAGDASKEFVEVYNDALRFDMPSPETYAYVENPANFYRDVYVEAEFSTLQGGRNGMAVICRASADGWYEVRMSTVGNYAGAYEVYRYDPALRERKLNPYFRLLPTERSYTRDIKTGFNKNTLGLLCSGNSLVIYINGVEQTAHKKEIIDDVLSEGTVGVGVMSFSGGKVLVDVTRVTTQAP